MSKTSASREAYKIPFMINELNSYDGMKRQKTRKMLVSFGTTATPFLLKALTYPVELIRWEAAKALGEIKDPDAAEALVRALQDESINVRWTSMDSLIELGQDAICPLFEALREKFESVWLREGAHHILHVLMDRDQLTPSQIKVFEALESVEPDVQVPWAVDQAMKEMKGDSPASE